MKSIFHFIIILALLLSFTLSQQTTTESGTDTNGSNSTDSENTTSGAETTSNTSGESATSTTSGESATSTTSGESATSTTSGGNSNTSGTNNNGTTSGLPTVPPLEQELIDLLKGDPCFANTGCDTCVSADVECVWCPATAVPSCEAGTISGAKNESLCGRGWYWKQCSITGDSTGIDQSYIIYIICICVAVVLLGVIVYVVIATCSHSNEMDKKIKRLKSVNKMSTVNKDKEESDEEETPKSSEEVKKKKKEDESTTYSSLQ